MSAENLNRFWAIVTVVLILIILANALFLILRNHPGQRIAIIPPVTPPPQGQILVDGAVNQPGLYPLRASDDIDSLLAASGGITGDADPAALRLYIPHQTETAPVQRIDLNRADAWLLEALPDIGPTKAEAIVRYRQEHGAFHTIQEICSVPGISASIFENIKGLICISD